MSNSNMKTNASGAICTVNHLSYARVLNQSLRSAKHKETFYLLVPDFEEKHRKLIDNDDINIVTLDDLSIPEIDKLIEKY